MKIKIKKESIWFFILLVSPTFAFSYSGSGDNAIVSVLNGLITLLTSTIARLLMVVAIIGIGYGTLYLGKIPKGRAIASVIGIGIIFGSSYLASSLGVGA